MRRVGVHGGGVCEDVGAGWDGDCPVADGEGLFFRASEFWDGAEGAEQAEGFELDLIRSPLTRSE